MPGRLIALVQVRIHVHRDDAPYHLPSVAILPQLLDQARSLWLPSDRLARVFRLDRLPREPHQIPQKAELLQFRRLDLLDWQIEFLAQDIGAVLERDPFLCHQVQAD